MPAIDSSASDVFRRILSRNLTLPLAISLASALVFVSLLAYLAAAIADVRRSDDLLQHASTAQRVDLDMESALRGFLVDGDERFARQYDEAAAAVGPAMQQLADEVRGNAVQTQRLQRIQQLQAAWRQYARERMAAKRMDPKAELSAAAGRELKDQVRTEFDNFFLAERRARADRIETTNQNALWTAGGFVAFMLATGIFIAWRGRRDLTGLASGYEATLAEQQRQADVLQAQAWLREGQSQLSERLAGEQELAAVASPSPEFTCR